MSFEHTMFSLMMPAGKRFRSQTKEVVVNVYDYFEELDRCKRTEGSLKQTSDGTILSCTSTEGETYYRELPFQLQQRGTASPDTC